MAGGVQTTAWTCAYESTEPDILKGTGLEEVPDPGCAAAAGTSVGPVTVVYGNFDTDVETQASTVTFTNTFVAPVTPPVQLQPNFTG